MYSSRLAKENDQKKKKQSEKSERQIEREKAEEITIKKRKGSSRDKKRIASGLWSSSREIEVPSP